MPQRNVLFLILAVILSYVCYAQGQQNPYRRYLGQAVGNIDRKALEKVPDRRLFGGAMNGLIGVLRESGDPHSQFYDETQATRIRNEIHQSVGGVGVRITIAGAPPRPVLLGPIRPDSPAGRAKLAVGDLLLEIDGKDTAGSNLSEIADRLAGVPGSAVLLKLANQHDAQSRIVELVRENVATESVFGDRRGPDGNWIFKLENEPRIALLQINAFGDRTPVEFASVMQEVVRTGVGGIALDLRDNAGGSLAAAVAICQQLLPAGKTIVETRGRDQVLRERYTSKSAGAYRDVPLAVIINQNSASASEIVAACLQDHGRAIVVGQRSFGKGTVQDMLPLGRSLLKLTSASFWRPSGANIHRLQGASEGAEWGVSPDEGYRVMLTSDEYKAFRAYRNERNDSDAAAFASSTEKSPPSLNDECLKRAVTYLMQHLRDKL